MSSRPFVAVGTAELLPWLKRDVRRAREELLVVCPWLDAFFAWSIASVALRSLPVRILMRPATQTDAVTWGHMLDAVATMQESFAAVQVRTLERLHAKCIVVDRATAYVGSANYYAFSLEQSREVTLRGPIDSVQGLAAELERLWCAGSDLPLAPRRMSAPSRKAPVRSNRVAEEISDPVVARVLRENPKAWVHGRKR